jgi:hypothetical protein
MIVIAAALVICGLLSSTFSFMYSPGLVTEMLKAIGRPPPKYPLFEDLFVLHTAIQLVNAVIVTNTLVFFIPMIYYGYPSFVDLISTYYFLNIMVLAPLFLATLPYYGLLALLSRFVEFSEISHKKWIIEVSHKKRTELVAAWGGAHTWSWRRLFLLPARSTGKASVIPLEEANPTLEEANPMADPEQAEKGQIREVTAGSKCGYCTNHALETSSVHEGKDPECCSACGTLQHSTAYAEKETDKTISAPLVATQAIKWKQKVVVDKMGVHETKSHRDAQKETDCEGDYKSFQRNLASVCGLTLLSLIHPVLFYSEHLDEHGLRPTEAWLSFCECLLALFVLSMDEALRTCLISAVRKLDNDRHGHSAILSIKMLTGAYHPVKTNSKISLALQLLHNLTLQLLGFRRTKDKKRISEIRGPSYDQ